GPSHALPSVPTRRSSDLADTPEAGGSEDAAGGEWADCTPGAESAEVDLGSDENTDITIGAFNGWDESFAAAHLTKHVLEEDGFRSEEHTSELQSRFDLVC